MTHTQSAYEAKNNKLCPWAHMVPSEGTKIRELFDLFKNHAGEPVKISKTSSLSGPFARLEDTYGFDLRNVGRGRWMLAGEWFGKVYVDYVAEKLKG